MLFSVICFAGLSVRAQVFTHSNEPMVGQSVTMYVCDTNAMNLSNVTGSGAVWDYTNLTQYQGQTALVSVVDPTSTMYGTFFPTATKAINIEGVGMSYIATDLTTRTSLGYALAIDPTMDALVYFDNDDQTIMNYPYSFGSSPISDNFAGTLVFDPSNIALNDVFTGDGVSTIDGQGTLNLPNGVSIPNVTRVKVTDQGTCFFALLLQTVVVTREQYEYYDLANSALPIFTHAKVDITLDGSSAFSATKVLSAYDLGNSNAGLSELKTQDYLVYPNPANDIITIQSALNEENATAKIVDLNGKIVMPEFKLVDNNSINVESIQSGSYIMIISTKDGVSHHNVTIK